MVSENQCIFVKKEKVRIVHNVLVFDVDGVLTHPSEKRITEPKILPHLIKKLESNEPIIFNTGRATNFIINNILKPLEYSVKNKKILSNVLAIGEKGAVSIVYDNNGNRTTNIDQSIVVSKIVQNEAKDIVDKKFSDIAFYDQTKKTMVSIEMINNLSLEKFTKRQKDLNMELTELLDRHGLLSEYKVDPSRIATDIENNHVGKGLGIQKALLWLDKKNIKAEQFITFGDSKSDIDMAIELHKHGLSVEFVFVGEKYQIDDKNLKFPVTYTEEHYEAGTIEYLNNLEK